MQVGVRRFPTSQWCANCLEILTLIRKAQYKHYLLTAHRAGARAYGEKPRDREAALSGDRHPAAADSRRARRDCRG
ncbi:hypothetical protein CYMTET_23371 [Cymbomonas tetramitiformis]|uniref:Uncharacterized protein n=1 Tax=Cymbomonas tetramitiformis TaxID=36881 RepID=A0AAE0L1B8_9CHLO|nr:hypothetical protein CYMTET_23371 [Cymbomonas tetramitiformis]